jgi:hypothetical protein
MQRWSPTVADALAWADIKVNRAWVRSSDFRTMAMIDVPYWRGDAVLASWENGQLYKGLILVESDLRSMRFGKLFSERSGRLAPWPVVHAWNLKDVDRGYATTIVQYHATLKAVIKDLRVQLVEEGSLGYAEGTLSVPRKDAALAPRTLGENVVNQLVAATPCIDEKGVAGPRAREAQARRAGLVRRARQPTGGGRLAITGRGAERQTSRRARPEEMEISGHRGRHRGGRGRREPDHR